MERRLYQRISLPIKVRYELNNRPRVISEAVTKDISGGGACLIMKEKLMPKTQITMKIEVAGSSDVTLKGTVLWVKRFEIEQDTGPLVHYETGVEFSDANPININRVITHYYNKSL